MESWPYPCDLLERQAGSTPSNEALGGRTHQFVDQRAQEEVVWCTERVDRVIDFWLAFSGVIITVGRLIRRGWTHYRWEGRPCRRP
jgi:hypothetical protein